MLPTHQFRGTRPLSLLFSSLLGLACANGTGTDGKKQDIGAADPGTNNPDPGTKAPDPGGKDPDPGTKIPDRAQPAAPAASLVVAAGDDVPDSLRQALSAAAALDGAGLQRAYPSSTAALDGDISGAAGMTAIQASALRLNGSELLALGNNGLVISARQQFPSFAYGYKAIYSQDLPLYISADSILEALHRSFDQLLELTEETVLIDELSRLLEGMQAKLKEASLEPALAADVDVYLALASSLLKARRVDPVVGGSSAEVAKLYQLVQAAQGHDSVRLFGAQREEDFSQFAPRGHYTNSERLANYFRAMTWLGRVDLRLIETQPDGTQLFQRRQFDAAVALNELMGPSDRPLWEHIDSTVGAFAGEHDSLTPRDLAGLLAALHVSSPADSAALTNQQIADEMARGGWGAQRIASRIIVKNFDGPTLPLDRSFSLFGQRYTVDSHTFVNVSYDRVKDRLMPRPLDVAFAALGNNSALPLLSDEFGNASYPAGLAKTRTLIDAHEASYWEGSLYTRWLGALRSLSPQPGASPANIVPTAGWQKRILSTQLGSWAELRHDTILYSKQSYTAGALCAFPDAYVDPYPEFYARLGALAEAAAAVVSSLPGRSPEQLSALNSWSQNFQAAMANLRTMAEDQVSGAPHSPELIAFVNDAVKWDETPGCAGPAITNLGGWYLKLHFYLSGGLEDDPVVADVHTQPTDAAGNDLGRVLHVGTGRPRLMVVTANTCEGPRAYAGLAFSYGELVTENWERLNDEQWRARIDSQRFPDAAWMGDVVAK